MTDQNPRVDSTEPKSKEVVLPEYLRTLLEKIAVSEGFAEGYNIISRPGSNVGDGFQGLMLSVVISGTRQGKANDDLVLICKIPPMSELRQKLSVTPFKQEIAAYETLLPALVKFQQEKGISETDGFYAFPKCYGTYADEDKYHFALVLADLRHTGFRMWDKYSPIDFAHVQLALTQLGRLHAISFALRQQRPEIFSQFQSLGSRMYRILEDFPTATGIYEKSYDRAIEALSPEDMNEIQIMRHLRHNFMANFRYATSGTESEPFTVFSHGDFWNNNMMFQYCSADSMVPQRAVLIDWQLAQYCSPASDLTYYLYSSTEKTLRDNHFGDCLRVYHESLSLQLQRLGGNVDKQFSFDDLQNQMKSFGIYGLILAPMLIQIVTVKAENLPDMDELTDENLKDFDFMANGSPEAYSVRVRDVIRDFVGRGFFSENHFAMIDDKSAKV